MAIFMITARMSIGKIAPLHSKGHTWVRKKSTLELEACADSNLWFWHALVAVNILDATHTTHNRTFW